MKISARGIVKFVTSATVGVGTSTIVKNVIANNVPAGTSLKDKITVGAATWVLSAVITAAGKKYTDEIIDDIADHVSETAQGFKIQAKLDRINKNETTFKQEDLNQNDFDLISGRWTRRATNTKTATA